MIMYTNIFGVDVMRGESMIHLELMVGTDEKLYIVKPSHTDGEYLMGETPLLSNSYLVGEVVSCEEQVFLEGLFLDNLAGIYGKALTRKSRSKDSFTKDYNITVEYYNDERYEDKTFTSEHAIARRNVTCTIPPRVLDGTKIWTYQ